MVSTVLSMSDSGSAASHQPLGFRARSGAPAVESRLQSATDVGSDVRPTDKQFHAVPVYPAAPQRPLMVSRRDGGVDGLTGLTDQMWSADQVAIYARDSAAQQERAVTSLDRQVYSCLALVAKDGWVGQPMMILREHSTAADLERQLLDRLRAAIVARRLRAVYVYSPDRLSRDPLHLLAIIGECSKAGVGLIFVRFDTPDTPDGRLMT